MRTKDIIKEIAIPLVYGGIAGYLTGDWKYVLLGTTIGYLANKAFLKNAKRLKSLTHEPPQGISLRETPDEQKRKEQERLALKHSEEYSGFVREEYKNRQNSYIKDCEKLENAIRETCPHLIPTLERSLRENPGRIFRGDFEKTSHQIPVNKHVTK